jgi:DUF971 family protein
VSVVSKPVEVIGVDIDKTNSVRIEFADEVIATFPLADLRAACPCAGCRGDRERGTSPWPRPGQPAEISVRDAELVGAWGISISWSDGHEAGIYPWDRLRRWHDANEAGQLGSVSEAIAALDHELFTDTVDES